MERVGIGRAVDEYQRRLTLGSAIDMARRLVTPNDVSVTVELLNGGAVHMVGTKRVGQHFLQSDRPIGAIAHGGRPEQLLEALAEIAADLGRQEVAYLNRKIPTLEVGRIAVGLESHIAAG